MPRSVASPKVINIDDLRREARRRLPRAVFDYIDGGADREWTLRANSEAFRQVFLRPHSAVDTGRCELGVRILGESLSLPLLLAPVGSSRLFHPRGEEHAARAAGKAGTGFILSTLGGCPLEDVKRATNGPAWYQLYLVGGRDVARAAIERAKAVGYTALVVTIDTAVPGLRERDHRNGIVNLLGRNLGSVPYLWQILSRPGWLIDFLRDGGLMSFPNVVLPSGPMPYAAVTAALTHSVTTWSDFTWIREAWPGPIVAKGAHTADDARRAVDAGASAVVVSNHGGRQLDGVAPTLRVLPEVVDAVGAQVPVLLDGGIRSGSDIVKAMCLGAKAVLIGRAYAYGLAAAGETGVTRAIEILREGLERTLRLMGCESVTSLDRSFVSIPKEW